MFYWWIMNKLNKVIDWEILIYTGPVSMRNFIIELTIFKAPKVHAEIHKHGLGQQATFCFFKYKGNFVFFEEYVKR